MFCSHCGKKINERALEQKQSSYVMKDENGELLPVDTDKKVEYVCPQCGHLAHVDLNDEELKSLSRAAHSQLQRGANSFALGMAFNIIGIIVAILAFSFYLLSFRSAGGVKTIDVTKSTFLVFVVMGAVAVILLGFGIFNTIVGLNKKVVYTKLLKDLNNKTFVQ